jgi:hypothetical protein
MRTLRTAVLIIAISYFPSAFAVQCYEESPNLATQGEDYFNVDDQEKLSYKDIKKVKNYVNLLKGEWVGDIVEISCSGPDKAPKKKTKRAAVEAELSKSSKSPLIMTLKKEYSRDGVYKGENLYLLNKDTTNALEISDGNLSASDKQRKPGPRASRLVETISTVDLNGTSLNIYVTYYSNGVLVYSQKMSLEKS